MLIDLTKKFTINEIIEVTNPCFKSVNLMAKYLPIKINITEEYNGFDFNIINHINAEDLQYEISIADILDKVDFTYDGIDVYDTTPEESAFLLYTGILLREIYGVNLDGETVIEGMLQIYNTYKDGDDHINLEKGR